MITKTALIVLTYIGLIALAAIYVSCLFAVWEQRKRERKEWEQYWDEVFERNKNLNQ